MASIYLANINISGVDKGDKMAENSEATELVSMAIAANAVSLGIAIVLSVILLGFAATVLGKIWQKSNPNNPTNINLAGLLQGNTKASLSRFQFLIFTFVIAGLFLALSIESGTFVEIPGSVLALMGISSAGYAAGKSLSKGEQQTGGTGGTGTGGGGTGGGTTGAGDGTGGAGTPGTTS